MFTWEYNDDVILNRKQLEAASEWFVGRLDELDLTNITYIGSGRENFVIEHEWDDYCRGCHMGTHQDSYTIPNDIFFSEQSLRTWICEEDKRRKEKKEKERQKKEKADQRARAKQERQDYERLKAKFEKKGDK